MGEIINFLLVFDRTKGQILSLSEFADADEAVQAYNDEERYIQDNSEIEVVLLGADSIDTLKKTHGYYFSDERSTSKYRALSIA